MVGKKTVSEEDCKELEQAMKEQLEQSDGKSVLDTETLMNKALTMKVTGRETVNNVSAIVIESELKMDDFLDSYAECKFGQHDWFCAGRCRNHKSIVRWCYHYPLRCM